MIRKTVPAFVLAAGIMMATTTPANATGSFFCKIYPKKCTTTSTSGGTTTTTSGGTTTTSGGTTTTSGGTTTTSGGTTTTSTGGSTSGGSSSGGTPVPEPGMLGLMGLGAAGVIVARRRMARRKA